MNPLLYYEIIIVRCNETYMCIHKHIHTVTHTHTWMNDKRYLWIPIAPCWLLPVISITMLCLLNSKGYSCNESSIVLCQWMIRDISSL